MAILQSSMSEDEAASALVTYIFSGDIGSPKGKGVCYSLLEATDSTFSWIAALEDKDSTGQPIDRYLVDIDRPSRKIQPSVPIALSETELQGAVLAATGHHLKPSSRFTNRALSISYKVLIQEDPDIQYVVQLCHHGNVTSMNLLMTLISSTIDSSALPLPIYPRRRATAKKAFRMGRQISRLIPGLVANSVYLHMSHEEKRVFVQNMALAF